jgi:hypothetical protein
MLAESESSQKVRRQSMMDPTRQHPETDVQEARCDRCGETFVVADGITSQRDDVDGVELLHVRSRLGELCGGNGVPFRKYVIRNPNRL